MYTYGTKSVGYGMGMRHPGRTPNGRNFAGTALQVLSLL